MFTAPGNASSWPTVPMMWCSDRQMRSTASAASDAPSSASRRMSYGVPPAWRASPSTSSWNLRALAMDDTTASDSPRRSSSGPCSMCASRYPTRSDGRRAASPMRPGSSPKSRKASRTRRALGIRQRPPVVVPRAGDRRRAEQRLAEPGALFVREGDDLEREREAATASRPPRSGSAAGARPRAPSARPTIPS